MKERKKMLATHHNDLAFVVSKLEAAPAKVSGEVHWIPIADLNVDHAYQRRDKSINQRKIDRMAADWRPEEARVIEVSQRDDGTRWVIDGQHRVLAARKAGLTHLLAKVWYDLSPQDESDRFDRLNDPSHSTLVAVRDRFRSRQFSQHPTVVAIERAVAKAGYAVSTELNGNLKKHGVIVAIKGLQDAYGLTGEDGLYETLRLIRDCFNTAVDATSAPSIVGFARFWKKYGPHLTQHNTRKQLVSKLQRLGADKFFEEVDTKVRVQKLPKNVVIAQEVVRVHDNNILGSSAKRIRPVISADV